MSKIWPIHTVEYYSVLKRKEIIVYVLEGELFIKSVVINSPCTDTGARQTETNLL